MRVYRQTFKNPDGKQQVAEKWYLEFRNRSGKVCRLAAYADKRQTEDMGRKLDAVVGYQQSGEPIPAHLSKFLSALPDRILRILAKQDVIDAGRMAGGVPLLTHLDGEWSVDGQPHVVEYDAKGLPIAPPAGARCVTPGFAQDLTARGNRDDYARLAATRVRRMIRGCGFTYWRDVTGEKVQQWLAAERKTGKGKDGQKGMSFQTSNWYLQKAKEFSAWMAKRLGTPDPLLDVKGVNVSGNKRHERRAMSLEEVGYLLDATATGKTYMGMTGPERWLMYRFALETGLRPKQVAGLTRAAFQLDGSSAKVTAAASYSKNKRANTIPLRDDLAELLREHLQAKTPATPAFRTVNDRARSKIYKRDLAAARKAWLDEAVGDVEETARREASDFLRYRDSQGHVIDLYSARHTFITNLARAGVHPKTAQALAQHSTIALTMNIYSHVTQTEEAAAVAKLPGLPAMKKVTMG